MCEKVKYGWVGEGAELGKDSILNEFSTPPTLG